MKKALKFLLVGFAASAMIFGFASCSDDEEDEKAATTTTTENNGENGDSTTTTTENNGTTGSTTTTTESTNPFSGKTWRLTQTAEDFSLLEEFAFENATVKLTQEWHKGEDTAKSISTCKYTYDAANSFLFLEPQAFYYNTDGQEYSYSSPSEAETILRNTGYTGAELAYYIDSAAAGFNIKNVYKYEFADNNLKLTSYFDGSLPPSREFKNNDHSLEISFDEGEIWFDPSSQSGKYVIVPEFTDGNFSGTFYKRVRENGEHVYTSLGNAAGTYSTSGTGSEGCTITLKFTALPDEAATAISLNTDYVLDQESEDSEEYTLVE